MRGSYGREAENKIMLSDLVQGYRRYRNSWSEVEREFYRDLVERGQSPEVMIIACCDSRVDPSTILDTRPGSIFMVRNVANLVPPYTPDGDHHGTSAALEFAVRHIEVKHIIVMGHAHCGGIRALYESDRSGDFILPWMEIVAEARNHIRENCSHLSPALQRRLMEEEAIRVSLRNLMTFDWIRERVESGKLKLHGWYYALAEGLLLALNPETNSFHSLLENDIPE
jgi:carbonic anhydrase